MGSPTEITSLRRTQASSEVQEPYRAKCKDCGDFGYIGNLKAVGDRNGHTYVELQRAVDDHRLAFCGCGAGEFQRSFLREMGKS